MRRLIILLVACVALPLALSAQTVTLTTGTLNGQSVVDGVLEMEVVSGGTITGSITVETNNPAGASNIAPLVMVWNWGTHETGYTTVNSWISSGISSYTQSVNIVAPMTLGVHYISFAFALEKTGAQVASLTNWQVDSEIPHWNDGCDIADWGEDEYLQAVDESQVLSCYEHISGMGQATLGAAMIKVTVTPNIGLDHVDGLYAPDTILAETPVTFHLRFTNGFQESVFGISNGFRVYSSDDAVWDPIGIDTAALNWSSMFNLLIAMDSLSVTGEGEDTVSLSAVAIMGGMPSGSDEVALYITTELAASQAGKTICLDSCQHSEFAPWSWGMESGGDVIPTWDGPHCFTIVAQPHIMSISPLANQTDVDPDPGGVGVAFDIDIDEASLNATTVLVNALSTGRHAGSCIFNSPTKSAIFVPYDPFAAGERVEVTLTTGITSDLGIPLAEPITWTFTTAAEQGSGQFADPVSYPLGDTPQSVVASDFDGDGYIDIAIAHRYSKDIYVLMNNGDGVFAAGVTYPIGDGEKWICAADFNGDGATDLATSDRDNYRISVLMNNGDGTFAPRVVYDVGAAPRSITAADLNNDGYLDLATANLIPDNVSVLLNNGDGTFATHVVYSVGTWPVSVATADFNGDGYLDLATANQSSGNASVLLNNGDGTFATATSYSTGSEARCACPADFDGDGDADLAVANAGAGTIRILYNDGSGSFGYDSILTVTPTTSVFAADVDADGYLDLVTGGMECIINNGDGSFAAPTALNGSGGVVYCADVDADSDMDIVTSSGNVLLNLNHPDPLTVYPQPCELNIPTVADLTIGFHADVDEATLTLTSIRVRGNRTGIHTGSISYDQATRTATFAPSVPFANGEKVSVSVCSGITSVDGIPMSCSHCWSFSTATQAATCNFVSDGTYPLDVAPTGVHAANLDGDTDIDLAVLSRTSGEMSILLNGGDGAFTVDSVYQVGNEPSDVITADFDGDMDMDVAVANLSAGTVSVLLNNGDGTYLARVAYQTRYADLLEINSVETADVNGDGHLDLVVAGFWGNLLDYVPSFEYLSVLLNNGDGTFQAGVNYSGGGYHVGAGDFDGDGDMDLASCRGAAQVYVSWNKGDGTFTAPSTLTTDYGAYKTMGADLDADGDLDVVSMSTTFDNVSVVINHGNRSFSEPSVYPAGTGPADLNINDIDGDGDLDLIVACYGSDDISLLLNNGNGTFAAPVLKESGDGPTSLSVADLDGEGTMDLAFTNNLAGNIEIKLNQFVTGVKEEEHPALPQVYTLRQNYPNPFNPATVIAYSIPTRAHVNIAVYNILGQEVVVLVDDTREAGNHSVTWDGRASDGSAASTGIYFYRITAGNFVLAKKMLLLK